MAFDGVPGYDIYIGGVFALRNKAALQRANITHVLSVLRMHPDESLFDSLHHLTIEVDDVEDEDLLRHFATTNAFIHSGLDAGGGVLVHCAMGKSRSATVCVAYLLHQQPTTLNPGTALEVIRRSRPMVEPNEGFMAQLWLYHRMGCPDDVENHPMYQRWVSHQEIELSAACGRGPEMNLVRFEDELSTGPIGTSGDTSEIRCRRCRQLLATGPFINAHHTEDRAASKRAKCADTCSHIFLHPLTWMRPSLFPGSTSDRNTPSTEEHTRTADAPLSGRLTCPNPKCDANVGKFAWQGIRCNCGTWVVPGIEVARARVDMVEKPVTNIANNAQGRLGAMGIRLPPHMRSTPNSEEGSGKGNL